MPRSYSLADARKNLPSLLDEVENGQTVEITRRGEPVAVVMSVAEFQRTSTASGHFKKALSAWHAGISDEDIDVDAGFFDSLRRRSKPRDVKL